MGGNRAFSSLSDTPVLYMQSILSIIYLSMSISELPFHLSDTDPYALYLVVSLSTYICSVACCTPCSIGTPSLNAALSWPPEPNSSASSPRRQKRHQSTRRVLQTFYFLPLDDKCQDKAGLFQLLLQGRASKNRIL